MASKVRKCPESSWVVGGVSLWVPSPRNPLHRGRGLGFFGRGRSSLPHLAGLVLARLGAAPADRQAGGSVRSHRLVPPDLSGRRQRFPQAARRRLFLRLLGGSGH